MEKNSTDCTIITNITTIDDLHLKLLSFLSIRDVLGLSQVIGVNKDFFAANKLLHNTCNKHFVEYIF